MADDDKKPDELAQKPPGVLTPAESTGTPPPSSIPDAGELAGADEEKAAMVEQAKSRVAAVKESLSEKAASPQTPATPAQGPPKAQIKKKKEGPKPVDASHHPLDKKQKTQ